MRKRYHLNLLILFCLLLVGCGDSASDTPAARDVGQATATIQPSDVAHNSALISIDERWNHYTNHRLGFSIQVPKTHFRGDASCYWNETADDSSFRPLGDLVPVVVIEGEDRVFITSKSFSELTLPTQIPSGAGYRTEFDGCEMVENNLEFISQSEVTSYIWEIVVWEIASEDDLEQMVDAVFGECFQVGEIVPAEGGKYQGVRVQGDGLPVEESMCLLRGGYIFFYSPEAGKAATWLTGQSYHFLADAETSEAYDAMMVESFEFIAE